MILLRIPITIPTKATKTKAKRRNQTATQPTTTLPTSSQTTLSIPQATTNQTTNQPTTNQPTTNQPTTTPTQSNQTTTTTQSNTNQPTTTLPTTSQTTSSIPQSTTTATTNQPTTTQSTATQPITNQTPTQPTTTATTIQPTTNQSSTSQSIPASTSQSIPASPPNLNSSLPTIPNSLSNIPAGILLEKITGHTGVIQCICISPDGKFIVTGSDKGEVILWNAELAQPVKKFVGHTKAVTCCAFDQGQFWRNKMVKKYWPLARMLLNSKTSSDNQFYVLLLVFQMITSKRINRRHLENFFLMASDRRLLGEPMDSICKDIFSDRRWDPFSENKESAVYSTKQQN